MLLNMRESHSGLLKGLLWNLTSLLLPYCPHRVAHEEFIDLPTSLKGPRAFMAGSAPFILYNYASWLADYEKVIEAQLATQRNQRVTVLGKRSQVSGSTDTETDTDSNADAGPGSSLGTLRMETPKNGKNFRAATGSIANYKRVNGILNYQLSKPRPIREKQGNARLRWPS
ncbi:hypothetical protein DFQ26_008979 [Actinomortierella ambigua]|nr:hypothetical protein DFQ26_008979 [Actinomortierella ambigua]